MTNELMALSEIKEIAGITASTQIHGSWKKEDLIVAMLQAQADGTHVMKALQKYHIVMGRISMKADAMLAEFQTRKGLCQWLVTTDKLAKAKFTHWNGTTVVYEYTIDDAQKEGLVRSGGPWMKMPKIMLRKRCISHGLRMCAPEIVLGIYTPEEIKDYDMGTPEDKPEPQRDAGFGKDKKVEAKFTAEKPKPVEPKKEEPKPQETKPEDENQDLQQAMQPEETTQEPEETVDMCTEKDWKDSKKYAKDQDVTKEVFAEMCSKLLIDPSKKTTVIPESKRQQFLDAVVEWKEAEDAKTKDK